MRGAGTALSHGCRDRHRFDTLRRELGDRFIAVEFEGEGHSVLTRDRQEEGVARVLDFFDEKLDVDAGR